MVNIRFLFAPTTTKVNRNTDPEINIGIKQDIENHINHF